MSTLPSWRSTLTGSPPPKPSLQRTLTTWTAGCSSSSIASAGWLVKILLNCKSLEAVDHLFPPCCVFPDYMEPLRSIDEARETYEELVATFPTSGRYWKAYIEQVDFLPGPVCFTGLKLLFRRSEHATMSALNFFSSAVLSEFSPSSSGKPICSTSRSRRFSHWFKTSWCNFFSSIGDKSLSDHLQGEDGPGLRFCSG